LCISQIDIAGVVVAFETEMDIAGVNVAFETEVSVADWRAAKFSPKPIATASPAATATMIARIEVSCPCESKLQTAHLRAGHRGRGVSYFTPRIIIFLMETIKDL
jgi:hypothetical protein